MLDKKPFFSIIIPTYNSADKLQRALNSVDNQTFRDFEAIVCDDGSVDHTAQVIEDFQDKFFLKYIYGEHWGGPARPKNNGLKIAQGEYIAFLDSDDWWYPDKLTVVKKFLHDADIAFHDLNIYTSKGKKIFKKVKGRHLQQPVFVDLMKNTNALINSSVVVKKSIIDRVGGITEGFLTCVEDFDLWLKISLVTEKFAYIPKSLGAYWLDSNNISAPSKKIAERTESVYKKYLDYLKGEDRKQAELMMIYVLGTIKQRMGLFDEALNLFKMSLKIKNFNFKLRSLIWVILIKFFSKIQK